MGVPINVRGWREAAGADVLARLAGDLALFVVDDPDRPGVVAPCGAGTTRRLRGPRNLTAAVGYVQWISTDPWQRRYGLALRVTGVLLEDYRRRGVRTVELHATPEGEVLYRPWASGEGVNPWPAYHVELTHLGDPPPSPVRRPGWPLLCSIRVGRAS